jgi:hypothetical protein
MSCITDEAVVISQRERIIRDLVERCRGVVAPVPVLRQPTLAISRDQSPALILNVLSDTPVRRSNDRLEREVVVQLTAYARDPADGHAIADELICRAHQVLLADPTLGALAMGIDEMDADYQAEDADADAIAIQATYRITYRTLVSDISQGG